MRQIDNDDPDTKINECDDPEVTCQPGYSTVYARKVFSIPVLGDVQSLALRIDYDDSYIVYINGSEVARSASASGLAVVVPFDATTGGAQHEAGISEDFGIDPSGLLVQGENIIAVQAGNEGSQAGFIMKIEVIDNKGKTTNIVTDASWKVAAKATGNWKTAVAGAGFGKPHVIGKYGVGPWAKRATQGGG